MRSITVQYVVATAATGLMALAVAASDLLSMPPLKTGLWESTMERMDGKGNRLESGSERMQKAMEKMPPEARARAQAMMKGRGMGENNGAIRICMTKEQFTQAHFDAMMAGSACKVTYATRTRDHWKWHSSCPTIKIESDGESTFLSPESYVSKSITTSTMTSKPTISSMTVTSKWLGANCGDIKPLDTNP
jgi:hypothetical protein